MKKFFGIGKKEDPKAKAAKMEETKKEMQLYKGQAYNPVEDDGITTESMFKVNFQTVVFISLAVLELFGDCFDTRYLQGQPRRMI